MRRYAGRTAHGADNGSADRLFDLYELSGRAIRPLYACGGDRDLSLLRRVCRGAGVVSVLTVTLRLPRDIADRLTELARAADISLEDAIVEVLAAALVNHELREGRDE